jgi:PAS domain S-box-containing protein
VPLVNDNGEPHSATPLSAGESSFRTLIDHAPVAVRFAREGKTLYVNQKFLDLYRFEKAEDVVGRPLLEQWAPEFRPVIEEQMRQRKEGDPEVPSAYEGIGQRSDGTKFPVHMAVSAVDLPDGRASVAILTDITQQREMQQAIERNEALLRSVLDATPFPVAIVNRDSSIEYWSRSAQTLFGYTPATTSELNHLAYPDPTQREAAIAQWKPALEKAHSLGGTHRGGEYHVTCRDGSVRNCEIYVAAVWDKLVVTFNDVTERKRSELHIRRLNRVYVVQSRINELIVRERDTQTMFESACTIAVDAGRFRMAWIGAVDPVTQVLNPVASAGVVDGYLDAFGIDWTSAVADAGSTARALISGKHQVCNDIGRAVLPLSRQQAALQLGYRSSAAFPLKVNGETVGVFTLKAAEIDFFDADEIRLLDELASDIGFAMEVHQQDAERQRITQSLEASEQQFANAFENAAIGMGLVAPNGRWIKVNRALCRMVGYTEAELCARTFQEITHPDDLNRDLEYFHQLLAGEIEYYEMEKRYFHKDGHIVWILLSVSLVRDEHGHPVHSISQIQDVTNRRHAENALRASEQRFRELAENIQDVFWSIDPRSGQILYVSPAYEKIWGHSCQSLYEQAESWIDAIHPEDRERIRRATFKQVTGETYDEEYRIVRPDQQIRWIRDTAFPVLDSAGKVERVVGVARDITDHRFLADQLRQSQKMEAIGQLAGGVAHDFNNMLGAIMMESDMLVRDPGISQEVREGLQLIRSATNRAAKLTSQLLLFSRKQIMQVRDLNMNEAVSNLAEMLQRLIGEHVHLHLYLHPVPLILRADAGMLDQIVMNLAVNARDAMPDGGRLIIETTEKVVGENFPPSDPEAKPGRYACLSVSDTGTGIPPDVLPRIFDPFFTTKEQGKGTGLGLSTVFGIVKQHGGFIDVESEPGRGTRFQVFLPASESIGKSMDESAEVKPSGGTETILVVEDEELPRSVMRTILTRNGYHVVDCFNGVEALERWETFRENVELLVTDLVMPGGISGRDLANRLQQKNPQLKVLFVSGYSSEMAGRQLELKSGEKFLQKPFPNDQFLAAVRRCLDGEA